MAKTERRGAAASSAGAAAPADTGVGETQVGAATPTSEVCSSIESALGVLGRAWAGAVLQAMLDGSERYSDIRRSVTGVSDAVLSARLRELVARGFALREVEAGPPVTVRYRLTDVGRDTRPVLAALQDFGLRHQALLDGR